MYNACKSYLLEHLKAAGVQTKPFTSMATLAKCMESHVAAVLFVSESDLRDGSKAYYVDQGAQKKRRKIFDRKLTYKVVIGDYTDEAVEETYEKFLAGLEQGIFVDGNYIAIDVGNADWVEKDDSILKAKVAVEVEITFDGGLYRDTGFAPIKDVAIDSVEKEN